jgi:hypothetical protein
MVEEEISKFIHIQIKAILRNFYHCHSGHGAGLQLLLHAENPPMKQRIKRPRRFLHSQE